MENSKEITEATHQVLNDYIRDKKLRKTPERYAILDTIYTISGHFNIEMLYNKMEKENYHVSRATLYNTMEILHRCNLVHKLTLSDKEVMYEKSYNCRIHNHMICTECGEIKEFSDINIRRVIQFKRYKNFTMTHFALTLYGICDKCKEKQKYVEQNKND